jgi:transcriptional regulator with XRE-family HTH domain
MMTEVGRRVTELRRSRGLSQEQFAERLRIDGTAPTVIRNATRQNARSI